MLSRASNLIRMIFETGKQGHGSHEFALNKGGGPWGFGRAQKPKIGGPVYEKKSDNIDVLVSEGEDGRFKRGNPDEQDREHFSQATRGKQKSGVDEIRGVTKKPLF